MGMEEATQVVGWIHGVLVFTYIIALWSTARVYEWSWAKTVAGFVASLIPFAPFIFAKKLHG
jgi:integral membrane protein